MDQVAKDLMKGIGGTDAAAIVGKNPWRSPIQVWQRLRGDAPPIDISPEMKWGTIHEESIATVFREMWAERDGNESLVTELDVIRHSDHPFIIGHLDGVIIKDDDINKGVAVWEAKTAKGFMRRHFGDPGSDEVPEQYLLQAQHYMGLTGLPMTYMPVLFEGYDLQIFIIQRNDELITDLFQIEVAFWNKYVLTGEPPPMDGSDACKKFLDKMYSQADLDNIVTTTDENVIMAAKQLSVIGFKEKEIKEAKQAGQNILKDAMGDAWRMDGPEFRVTWKNDKPKEKTNWEGVARELAGASKLSDEYCQAVIDAHTKTKEGSRRFLFKYEE